MSDRVSLDARLFGEAQRLLMEYLGSAVPGPTVRRDVVQEQDAVDALAMLTAALTEQVRLGRLTPDAASRMGALVMVARAHIRALPAGVADGTDPLGNDLAEMVAVIRAVSPRSALPRQGVPKPEPERSADVATNRFTA